MTQRDVLAYLEKHGSPAVIGQMKHFGIETPKAFGNKTPDLRALQRRIGTNHPLALSLWHTGYYEARAVAAIIADPDRMTEATMESWVSDFDSWALCDVCCVELFCYTPFAIAKVKEWSRRKEEFVKRAGFVLIPALAIHKKELDDDLFRSFLPFILRASTDERNFVRKGVNWALRQIGKKNRALHKDAVNIARRLSHHTHPTARWIGTDALEDLHSESTQRRFARAKERKKK